MTEFKQAIILRNDLGMGKGKLVAQGSHASLLAYDVARLEHREWASEWGESGCKKVTLKVGSEKELGQLFVAAKKLKLPAALVTDAGHTQVEPGTKTAVAIGPAPEKEVDTLTRE
ncbi:TPA: peptidyl-tRNA hydrolase, partial [Candidatus Micrarchaeota archaeon]|nr:peptidyl-tRNA hydrolase [Candidatus Micrarchaeota archaeon]